MSYSFDEAMAKVANCSALADLIDIVRNTSAQVAGSPENATSVLYSGTVGQEDSFRVAKALAASSAEELGEKRFVIVDGTEAGRLLFEPDFIVKLNEVVRADLANSVPEFSGLPATERNRLVAEAVKRVYNNNDASGSRLPLDPRNPIALHTSCGTLARPENMNKSGDDGKLGARRV